ncbi:hypothetical protein BO83DRAFT_411377 [Aspergillus eucalypticola CBS 122712]|uniref:Mid2 domain-containing protein n=1 Tax=Aspergillus eucalypticola (strain CBS 122712 / IBT 29274) TaxID=1448314 RepID=A0A317URV8_ASPEC|nr:uncharacterized protein BO83DRAFT_411377 [Aspergillus eucalypticola CBS 122712]PWY64391.1 hypothetical protein BO83DRAFT_411377 [Aspergillus eucalypticola CBS 122712]
MSSQVCHGMHNGVNQNIQADLPCGVTNSSHSYVTCCVNGDYCLSNSICVNTNDKDGDHYYAADCTDETLTDPACGTRSPRSYTPPMATGPAAKIHTGRTVNCSNPSDEIFPGVAPSKLATIQYLPSTASGTPTYAVASSNSTSDFPNANTTTTSSSSSTDSSSSESSGIGAGAAAGIGVGAAAGYVIVAAILALLYFRRRKAQNNVLPQKAGGYNGLGDGSWAQTSTQRTGPYPEMDGQPKVM